MKRFYIYLLLLLPYSVTGQQIINLSAPESGAKEHIARDYIRLLPGYSYKATGTYTMRAAIDEHIVIPASYQADQPSSYRSLNTSYAVGATAGAANVSPTGAAIYQIPIVVPPGTAGVQPNLSIVYNSQAGNGLLGYGWNLSGMSAISRCGKTYYHDGNADNIKLNATDNLMLDGQRLMLVSGSNMVAGSKYRTEIETYTDITCKTIGSYLCFEVQTKEGWTLQYGTTADSYIEASGSSVALYWLLAKATDPSGNYMTYTYAENNATGEFRLKQVDYTGNTGLSPYNRVEFFYETRTDQQTAYTAGKVTKQTVLLRRVKASSANTTFREYRLNYIYDGYYSKLTEVEEYGQNGARYNSTVVDWGDENGENQNPGDEYFAFFSPKDGLFPQYADFNGDGRCDFISVKDNKVQLYLSYDAFGEVSFQKKCEFNTYGNIPKGVAIADLNGDGLMDLISITHATGTYRYNYYFFDGNQFTNGGGTGYYGFNTTAADNDYIIADFNGDGKQEILIKSTQKLYNQYGNQIASGGITWGKDFVPCFPNNCYLTDFNGNGKTDIAILDQSGCKVYELNGSSFVQISTFASSWVKNSDGILSGDYNGDGLTDLLIQRNNSDYYILFSTGTTFSKQDFPDLNLFSLTMIGDINHDGKTDVIQTYGEYDSYANTQKMYVRTGTFTGSEFKFETIVFSNLSLSHVPMVGYIYDNSSGKYRYQPERTHFNVSDFDGDGKIDLIYDRFNNAVIFRQFNDNSNLLVKKIIDGMNRSVGFDYLSMTDMGVCKENGTAPVFPVSRTKFPVKLVLSMTENNSVFFSSSNFSYRNPRTHRQGKGFLGFGKIEVSDPNMNRKTVTDYGYNTNYFNVYPVKQTVTDYSGTNSISTVDFVNTHLYIGNKRIFPYISKQTTTDHLTGISTAVDYVFRTTDDGNAYTVTETRGNWKTVTTYTWEAKGSAFKNRPTNIEVRLSGLQGVYTQTTGMYYDNKGMLTSKIDFKGNTKAVTTAYSNFHPLGMPQTVTISANDCPSSTITIGYDGYGRPISKTDAAGTSETGYDLFSRVTSATGINGLTTSYEYDGFGNLAKELNPASAINYSQAWDVNGYQLYRTDRTETGGPSQSVWYNAAGQEIKSRTKGYSGDVYTKKEYNVKGQLYRSYLPGYGNPSDKNIEYEYYPDGRLKKEISISGITNYSYNNLSSTVTYPDGAQRITTLNSSGLTGSVSDDGGTVSYSYNSLGKPETITANGLNTYIRYDSRGCQRSLIDPNMLDSVRYVYDAYGMLRSQTDARGNTTTYTYDAAGRVISEVCPEMNLTYHYVGSGAGKGQTEYIKTGSTELRKIEYNRLGLPKQVTDKIDDMDCITSYTYDSYGRLLQKESPSGFKLLHEYNADGYLKALRNGDDNSLLWQAGAINAFGQVTSSTLGNGLTRTTTYSSANLTLQSIKLLNGAMPLDEFGYDFIVASGNLDLRTEKINNTTVMTEDFGYDGVNRLNSVKINNGTVQSITYQPNGNISNKFDVGDYLYDNSNHAVSGLNNLAAGYAPQAFELEHTSFNRTSKVEQGGKKTTFSYGPGKQRNVSRYYAAAGAVTPQTTRYYNGSYEKEIIGSTTKEFDYIYSPEGLAAIALKSGGTSSLYYTHTDHLGSLRIVTDGSKNIQSRYRYDAWGKRTLVAGVHITMRGFTGHEHMEEFGLINMNARMYDPALGRFLSVDPYVQAPDYTQSFNRYSYALNNPLIYTDPSGEKWKWWHWLVGDILTGGLISATVTLTAATTLTTLSAASMTFSSFVIPTDLTVSFFKGFDDPVAAGRRFNNTFKLLGGMFTIDENKKPWGQVWELFSRHTWEHIQTHTGLGYSSFRNMIGKVDRVDYFGGATFVTNENSSKHDGVTLGNYINMNIKGKITTDFTTFVTTVDPMYMHEYGHTIDSRLFGFSYLFAIGIPSAISADKSKAIVGDPNGLWTHDVFWTELRANRKAEKYFKNYYGVNWDYLGNPDFYGYPLYY